MESRKQFQEIFDELHTLSRLDKIKFLEELLYYFTIAGRGIWSDDQLSEFEMIEAFKWLNELTHRIWNIRSDLQQGVDEDSIARLYENMKFHHGQSSVMGSHLVPTTIAAFRRFKEKQANRGDESSLG